MHTQSLQTLGFYEQLYTCVKMELQEYMIAFFPETEGMPET